MDYQKFDINIVNPFIHGAIETFKVQCSFDARPGKPFMKGKTSSLPFDIAAEVNLKSANFQGCVSICFPKAVFLAMMKNMLDEEYTETTKDLEDGVCELLNITFGQAKKTLNEKGYSIEKAIPRIKTQQPNATAHGLILPFESEIGNFHIEVAWE